MYSSGQLPTPHHAGRDSGCSLSTWRLSRLQETSHGPQFLNPAKHRLVAATNVKSKQHRTENLEGDDELPMNMTTKIEYSYARLPRGNLRHYVVPGNSLPAHFPFIGLMDVTIRGTWLARPARRRAGPTLSAIARSPQIQTLLRSGSYYFPFPLQRGYRHIVMQN